MTESINFWSDCFNIFLKGNIGRPGPPGPRGPQGDGIQGPKVKVTADVDSLTHLTLDIYNPYLSQFSCSRRVKVKQCDVSNLCLFVKQ